MGSDWWWMKATQSAGARPVHQSVAEGFEFKSGGRAIALGFTGQRLSPHAGSAAFWGWLQPLDWIKELTAVLPHPLPVSNNSLLPIEKALAFTHGLLCYARKLTHGAHFCRDPLIPEPLGIRRVASQSTLSRFFAGFSSAGSNLRCFRKLWHWCLERLPSAPGVDILWTWTPPDCCMRTVIRKVSPWVMPSGGSSPVCIPCWR